eukprot:4030427-Pyramimonas_sp.AAC.1
MVQEAEREDFAQEEEEAMFCELYDEEPLQASNPAWTSPSCPRCGAPQETLLHQLWTCPANLQISGFKADLVAQAEDGATDAP